MGSYGIVHIESVYYVICQGPFQLFHRNKHPGHSLGHQQHLVPSYISQLFAEKSEQHGHFFSCTVQVHGHDSWFVWLSQNVPIQTLSCAVAWNTSTQILRVKVEPCEIGRNSTSAGGRLYSRSNALMDTGMSGSADTILGFWGDRSDTIRGMMT